MNLLSPSRLTVFATVPLVALAACDSSTEPRPASCDPGEGAQLQVGEVAESQGSAARIVCVTSSGTGAEYVLVAFAANTSASQGISLAARGEGLLPPSGAAPVGDAPATSADRGAGTRDRSDLTPEVLRDPGLDRRLRELERQALGSLVRAGPRGAGTAAAAPEGTAPGSLRTPAILSSVPSPGNLLEINTQTTSPCENPRYRTGRVVAVSEKAIVVADELNPENGFTDDHYQHFAATFDTLVAPLGFETFGEVSDVGENERTILFFTQDVNRLSEPGSDTFVGGFFFARDLFPRDSIPGYHLARCEHSNEAELLYFMVPDPAGSINSSPREVEFVERVTLTTMIHELQHLINAAQRLHIVQVSPSNAFEEVWLNEGLSHIAEELLLYRRTSFEPGQNLGPGDFPDGPLRVLFNQHQVGNLFRLEAFLEDPSGNSPYNSEDLLPTRGGTWHFLRYAADRRGGNHAAFFSQLVTADAIGLQNLADALTPHGPGLSQWFTDWAVTLFADDRVPGAESRYTDRSWNHRAFFAAINAGESPTYPLPLRELQDGTVRAVSLMGGGAAYFRFGLAAGGTGLVELTTAGANPPAGLRAVLLRIE